jgi:hypothetical protein
MFANSKVVNGNPTHVNDSIQKWTNLAETPTAIIPTKFTKMYTRSKALLNRRSDTTCFPGNFSLGDKVDIAASDNVWCSAQIVNIFFDRLFLSRSKPSFTTSGITVRYEGWSIAYNEDIFEQWRIQPIGSQVLKCKCWVYLNKQLPMWPCVMSLRTVVNENVNGVETLLTEDRVFVRLWGKPSLCTRPWNQGFWLPAKHVKPFSSTHQEVTNVKLSLTFNYKVSECWAEAVREFRDVANDTTGCLLYDTDEFIFSGSFETSLESIR